MVSHALTIVVNELEKHLSDTYGNPAVSPQVRLGNIAEGIGGGQNAASLPRDVLGVSMVNIREEKTLKNISNQVRNDAALKVVFENPPVFLNCSILIVATHTIYSNALLVLSRAIRFFQFRNVFDQDSVAPSSISTNAPANALDRLETFKLVFDLHSPTMEELNHLWGTLGGKQYPFALYTLRLVELQFKAAQGETGLITEVVNDVFQKKPVAG